MNAALLHIASDIIFVFSLKTIVLPHFFGKHAMELFSKHICQLFFFTFILLEARDYEYAITNDVESGAFYFGLCLIE